MNEKLNKFMEYHGLSMEGREQLAAIIEEVRREERAKPTASPTAPPVSVESDTHEA